MGQRAGKSTCLIFATRIRSLSHSPVRVVPPKTRTEGQNIRSSVSLQQTEEDYGRCSHLNQKEGGREEICFPEASSRPFTLTNQKCVKNVNFKRAPHKVNNIECLNVQKKKKNATNNNFDCDEFEENMD